MRRSGVASTAAAESASGASGWTRHTSGTCQARMPPSAATACRIHRCCQLCKAPTFLRTGRLGRRCAGGTDVRARSYRVVCDSGPVLAARAFPLGVRGPVDRSHGRNCRISSDCRLRRSGVHPLHCLGNVRSYENYRYPSRVSYTNPAGGITYQYPYGCSPQEATHEIDYGFTSGVRAKLFGWNWDLSTTYGSDDVQFSTIHSSNVGLYSETGASPTDFYDGRLKATQWTSNLDLNRDVTVGLAAPLNVAFGAEYRRDSYAIDAGSPSSYIRLLDQNLDKSSANLHVRLVLSP